MVMLSSNVHGPSVRYIRSKMSLVAYDSSDEGSENEESEPTVPITVHNDATEAVTVQINTKLSLPAPKVSQSTNDEEEDEIEGDAKRNFHQFLDTLPKPTSAESIEEVEDDILLKKESHVPKSAKRQTVRIPVPSLSEFKDLEEESEEKPVTIVQTSQKGCGLFGLLVAPKREMANSKILIPQAVKNMAAQANVWQSKTMKKSGTNDSKINKPTSDKPHDELSSDEEDATMDFFGLADKDVPGSSATGLGSESFSDLVHKSSTDASFAKHTEDPKIRGFSSVNSDTLTNNQSGNSSKTLTSNVINLPKEEILLKNKAEVGPKLPVPEQEYNVDVEGNVAFDEKAIEYLCGKRGVKRKEIDEANIIEINGEDIKPNEREWLVKALTEESVHRPVSMQSGGGVNSQSKKKHQITYLAHQAKAMELELKNQWSQNRMARKQTKSKYGF